MSDLKDDEIERLSRLLASGSMKHAREIVRLLAKELRERRLEPDPLLTALGIFLKTDKITN